MTKFLALFLFSAAGSLAQMQTLDLGSRGRLTLFLLGDWKVNTTNIAEQYTMTIQHVKESANANCKIEVTFPETDRYDTKARLKLRVEADCKAYEDESVEGKARAKELTLAVPSAYGFICNFTDANLRGKPSQPGNYKVVSAGKIRINAQVLVDVFIGADGFAEEAYQQLLGAIEGMEFSPGRGR